MQRPRRIIRLVLALILVYFRCVYGDTKSGSCDRQNYYTKQILTNCNDSNKNVSHDFDKYESVKKSIEVLWNKFPTVIALTNSENELCKSHSLAFLQQLNSYELWALQMFDSTAKLPPGILNGNVNQYGDFDQCLSINTTLDEPMNNPHISGKYCLVNMEIRLDRTDPLQKHIDSLIHSYDLIKSEADDIGHRVPRFSSIYWGICLPSSCSHEDLQLEVERLLKENLPNANTRVIIHPKMCQTNKTLIDKKPTSVGEIIARFIFNLLLGATILGSIYDYFASKYVEGSNVFLAKKQEKSESKWISVMRAFSVQNNLKKLMTLEEEKQEIRGIHGKRFLNVIALLMAHKMMAMIYNPITNRTQMSEFQSKAWSTIGRTAIMYTDTFIMFSGFLTAYSLFGELQNKGKINAKNKILSRLFRMTPNMVAIILFCTYYLPEMGSGPMWPLVVDEHVDLCKKYMWRNFLYIHNYFGFETMCLTHTHQVGLDMQLFLACLIIANLLWKRPRLGISIIVLICLISTYLRFWSVFEYDMSTIIFFGISLKQLFNTAKYSYILPTHRATVYFIGVLTAYFLKTTNTKWNRLPKTFGWIIVFPTVFSLLLGPFPMSYKDYKFNPMHAALYNALSPIAWGLFLSYGIIAFNSDHQGIISKALGDFFSWKGFRFCTKISYAIYLTQFPVYFYNVGMRKNSDYYSLSNLFNLNEVLFIVAVSILLTVLVEMPFQRIYRIVFSQDIKTKSKKCILNAESTKFEESQLANRKILKDG